MKLYLFLMMFLADCAIEHGSVLSNAAPAKITGPFCKPREFYKDWDRDYAFASAPEKIIGKLKFQAYGEGTLKFTGLIEKGDAKKFGQLLSSKKIKRLIVNSAGGEVEDGVKIGLLLQEYPIQQVIVDKFCLSSCANYLFTAAPTKWIREGIVGFHGNAQTLFGAEGEFASQIRSQMTKSKAKESEIITAIEATRRAYEPTIEKERGLYRKLGIRQELFSISMREDKGMGNQNRYAFLVLSENQLAQNGIGGVEGTESLCAAEQLDLPVVYWQN